MRGFIPSFMPHGPMSSLGDSKFGRKPGGVCVCVCFLHRRRDPLAVWI